MLTKTFKLLFIMLALFASLNLSAAPNGAQLFSKHCSVCHGPTGHGGVGVPLALPDFQYSVTNDYLRKTIRHGRPGRVMPAFTSLSDSEVEAIIKHLRTWAPGKPYTYPAKKIIGNVTHGKKLYAKNCAACHGANGEGGEGTGVTFSRPRNLPIIPPALNNSGFLAAAPDYMIKATLMNGREGTPMVSFLKHGLSEKDIDDVVAYVRSFEKHPLSETIEAPGQPLIKLESPLTLEQTVNAIKTAAIGKNFKIIRVQYLNQGLAEKGHENKKQVIVYFCNFDFLNRALAVDPRVGLFLPCRITAIEKNGKVTVMSTNPLYMSKLFNNKELHKLCQEMYKTYGEIIEESTF